MHEINRPVYVLGAGFCCDFQPGAFPLAANFLKVAKAQNVYRTSDVHRSLSMFITKYFGDDTSPDIERVLSFLAASPFDEQSAIEEDRASLYDQLVLIIAGTLTAVSASVAGRSNRAMEVKFGARSPYPGDYVWDLYSRFAEDLIDRHAVIITFNYDLLIDFLLRSTGSWGMHDGYGIEIPLIPPQLRRQNTSQSNSAKLSLCTLLKLHGSINWGVPISGNRSVSAEEVWQRVAAASTIYRLPDDGKYGLLNFQTFEQPETQLPVAFRPLIVPPVLDKSAWLKGSSLYALWEEAEKAVRTSEEITFIGYSLPPTDFLAEFMLQQGYRTAPNKQITVVAPDAKELVKSRFGSVFGDSIRVISKPFIKWAAENYFPTTATMVSMDDSFLQAAIEEARQGMREGGIPIGSILVHGGTIIGRGHNRRVQRASAILHGEMDALENAGRQPASVYRECILYTTLSPCSMCSGAILLYQIPRVIIGENRTFMGEEELLRSRGVSVEVLQNEECIRLMQEFIRQNPTLWNEDIGV